MLVNEFIQGYQNLKKPDLQKDFCQKHLRRTYAPIIEKNMLLKQLVDACVVKTENGIPYVDMVCNKMNLTHAIITLYTDLKLEDPNSDDAKYQIIRNYDAFQEFGILEIFCDLIGDREINELLLINKEALNTWHEAHSSIRAFFSDLTDKASRTFAEALEILSNEQFSPEKLKEIAGVIDNK